MNNHFILLQRVAKQGRITIICAEVTVKLLPFIRCAGGMLVLFLAASALSFSVGHYGRGFAGAVFMSSEVVFAALVGIFFFSDPVSWRFRAGSMPIIF